MPEITHDEILQLGSMAWLARDKAGLIHIKERAWKLCERAKS